MLIFTLTTLLAYTAFISTTEALLIASGIACLMYLSVPAYQEESAVRQPQSLYFYLQWSWLGYLPLGQAFWPFFVLFNGLLAYVDYLVQSGSFTVAAWVTTHIILSMPLIYWTGAVWRCSKNCSKPAYVAAARWAVALSYLDFGLRWVIYHQFPQIFFDCAQLINHWGDCL